jgi:hypothetical protein
VNRAGIFTFSTVELCDLQRIRETPAGKLFNQCPVAFDQPQALAILCTDSYCFLLSSFHISSLSIHGEIGIIPSPRPAHLKFG